MTVVHARLSRSRRFQCCRELLKGDSGGDGWARRFHVDKLSSAHVYVRLEKGETIDDIEPETLEDCAQLCKANSIQGTG
jgi:hypothetical protein